MTDRVNSDESTAGLEAGSLLRGCGEAHGDDHLWAEFQRRFQRRIFLYLLRACRVSGGDQAEVRENLTDLAQEVYVRLVQNDGRMLRTFRGDSEFAVRAFLARVATSVVADHFRYQSADKRQAQVISIDLAREAVEKSRVGRTDSGTRSVESMLSWMDVERVLGNDADRRHAARDLLIFKLHYVDGFTAAELAAFPGFGLSVAGVEAVLSRARVRLRQ